MKNDEIDKLLSTIPDNYTLAQQILELLNNKNTKVQIKDNIKGNYYAFVNDTIYISSIASNTSGDNKPIVIAHECRHSIQNKKIQLVNTIISNIVLFLIVLSIILIFFNIDITTLVIIATSFNIVIREYLELDATYNSLKILLEYISKYHSNLDINCIYNYYLKKIKLALILYFFKIIFDKFLPVIIIYIIKIIKNHIF